MEIFSDVLRNYEKTLMNTGPTTRNLKKLWTSSKGIP